MDTEADSVESIANETVLAFAHPDEFGRPDVLTSFTTIKAVFGMPSRANDPTAAILIPPQEANALARRVASVRASLALWKSKDKVKLMQVGLVLCLNVGIDQPAPGDPDFAGAMMDYRSVMSRTECWIDTGITAPGVSAKSIEGAVMRALTTAYTRLMPKQGIVKAVRDNAPTVDHIRKLFNNLRKVALGNCDRVLMHYNGHGMPRPTPAGELWALSTDQTEYVPIHARELKAWVGSPAMYVLDCSNAGVLMPYLIAPLPGTTEANTGATPSEFKGGAGTRATAGENDQLEPFIMAACSKGESLPLQTGLPADVFTCCLTCPLKTSLLWSLQTGQAAVVLPRAFRALIGRLPGKLSDRKSPLGELNWLLVAVTDTIAWTRLPRALFLRLFRQDFMVATLFRNYLLADRIMRYCGCVPLCNPPLPSTHDHPLWAQWDAAVLSVISQLPSMLGYTAFDMQRLDAIGTGLGSGLIRPNDVVAQAQAWGSDALNENPVSEQAPSAAPTAPAAGSSTSQAGAVGGTEGGGNAVDIPKDKLLRRAASGGIPSAGSGSDAGAVTALPVVSAPGLPAQSKQWAVIYHALEGGGQDPLALSLPPAASATARQRVRFLRHRLRHVQPTVISGLAPPPPPPVARSFGLGGLNPLIHLARPGRVGNVPLAGEFMAVEEDPRDPKAAGGSNYTYSYINTTFFTDALEGFEVWLRAASWVASRESARVADVLVDCMTASSGGPLALPPSNSASKVASAGELPSLARDSTTALSPPSSPTVLAAQRAGDVSNKDVTGTEDDEGVRAQVFTLGDAARIAHRTLRTQPPLLLPIQSSSGLGLGLNPGPLKGRDAVPSFPVAGRPAFHGGHPIPVVVTPRIRAPDQLPVLLQMVLSGQRRRAVELFARFLDLGPEAVNLALLVGLHNYVMKLLASAADSMKEREKERNESPLSGKDGASPNASSAPPPAPSASSGSMLPLGAYTGATVLILAKMLAVECTKSTALELVHKYSCISFLCTYMHAQAESRQRQLLARSGSVDPSAASGPGQGAGAHVAGGSSSPTGAGAAAAAAALEAEVEVRDPTLSITSDQTGAALFVLCKLLGTYPESCGDSCVRAHVLGVVSLLLNAPHPVAGNVQWALLCLSRLLLHDPAVAPGAPSGIPSAAQAILAGKVARLAPQRSSPAASPALHAANKQPVQSIGSDQAAPPAPAGSKDVSCSMLDSEYHRALPHLSALTVDTIVRCLAEPEPAVRAAAAVACSQLFVFSSKTDAAPRLGAGSSELGKEGGAGLPQAGGLLQQVLVNAAQYAVCRMALLHGAQDAVSAVTAVAVGLDKRRDGSQPRLASVRTEMNADGFHSAGSLKSTGSEGKGEDRVQTKVIVNPTLQAVGGSVSLPDMATLAAAELYVPVPAIRSYFSSTRMPAAQPHRPSKRGSAGKLASAGDGQRSGAGRMQVTIAPYTEGAPRVDVSDADALSQSGSGMQYARAAWYIAYCVVGSGGSGAFPLPLAGARNTVETHPLTKSVKQAAAARTERRRWVLLALARRMKKLMVPSAAIMEVPQQVIDGYHATVVQAHAAAAAAAASAMYMRQQAAAAVMAMPGGDLARPMADGSRGMQQMASGGAPVGLDSSGDGTGWHLDAADGVPLHEGGRMPSSAAGSREGSRGGLRQGGEMGLGMATGDPYDGQGAGGSMIDATYTGGSAGASQHPSLGRRTSDSELVALPNPLPLSATLPQLSIRASAQGSRPQPVSTNLPGPSNSSTLGSVAGSTSRLVSMTDVQGGRASPLHKTQSQGSVRLHHGQGGSFVGSPLASNSNKGPLMSEGSSSSLGTLSVKNALVGAVNAGRGGAAEFDAFAPGDKDNTGPPPPGLFAQLLAGAATHSTPASAVPGPRGSKSMPGTQSSAPSPVIVHDAPPSNFLGSALTAQARSPFGATTGTSSSGPNSAIGSMVLEGGSTGPRPAGGMTKNMSNTNLGALHPWAASGHAVTGSRGSAGLMHASSRQLQQGAVAPPPVPGLVGSSAAQAADRAKMGGYSQSTPDFGSSASGVPGAAARHSVEPNPAAKRLRPERAAEHVLVHCETLDREFASLASGMPQHVRTACMGACALPALSDASAAVRSEALALLACMLDSDPCHEAALCTVATLSLIDHLTGGPFLLTALGLTMSGGSAQQSGSGYASSSNTGSELPGTPAARRGRGPPTAPSPVDGPGGQANAGAGIAARAAAGRGTPAYNAGDGGGGTTPKPKAGLLKRVVAAVTGQKLGGQGQAGGATGGVPRTPGTNRGDEWSSAREASADHSPVASELFPPPSASSDHASTIGRASTSSLRKTRSPLFAPTAGSAAGNSRDGASSSDANAHMVIARDIRSLGLGLPEDILTLRSLYSCLEYTTAAYEHTHLAESGVTAQLAANAGTGSVQDILESAMASLGKPTDGRGGAREFFSTANTKAWAWLLSPSAGVGETPTAASLWVRTVSTTAVSNLGLPGVLYTAIWLCILSATSDPEPLVAAFAARLVRRTLYHVVEAAGLASVSSLPVQESASASRPGRRSSAGDVRAAGVTGLFESVDESKEKGRGSATSTATDATVEQDVPTSLTAEDKASIRVRYVSACASHWSTSFRPPSLAPDKQLALALKPGAMLQAFAKGPGLDLSFLTAAGGITSPNTGTHVVNGGAEGEPVWPGLLAGCDPSGSVHYEYACTRWYRPQLRPVSRSEDEDPISSSSLRNAARQRLTLAGLTEGTLLAATAYDDTLLRALSEASARVWDELQDHARFTRFTGLQTLLETRLGMTSKSQGGQAVQSRPGARSRAGSVVQGPLPRRRARVRSREGPLSGSMDATELVLQSLVPVDSSLQSFLRVLQSSRPSPVPGHPTGTRIFRLPDGTIRLLPPEVPLFSPVYLPPMYGLGYGMGGMGLDGAPPLAYPGGGQGADGSLPFQSPAFYPMASPFYDPMQAGMPWMMEPGYGPMALSMGTGAFGAGGLGMAMSMAQSPWVEAAGMGMDQGGADGNNPSAMQTPYVGSMGMAGGVGSMPGDTSLGSPATAHLPGASVGAAYPGFWSSHGLQAATAMDPSAGMMYHGSRQGAGLPTPMLMGLQGGDGHGGGVGSMPNTAHAMLLRADSSQGFLRGGSTPSFGPGGPSSTSMPGLRLGAGSGQMGSGQLANISATTSSGNLQWPAGQQAARTYGQMQGTPVYGSLGNVGLPLSPALGAVGGGMPMGELRLEGEQQVRRAANPALARVQGTAAGPEPSPPGSALHTVASAGNFNLGPSAAEAVGGAGTLSMGSGDGAKVAAISSSGPHGGDRSDHSRTLSASNGVTLMPAPSSFALGGQDGQARGAPVHMEGAQGGVASADGGQGALLPATVALGGEPADVLTDTAVEALARGLASTTPRLPLPLLARIPAAAVRLARESAKRMRQRATFDVSPHATSTACLLFHPTEELLFAVGGGSDVITRWDTRDGSPAGMFHASTGVSLHSSSGGGGQGMEIPAPAHSTPGLHTGALGSIGVHSVPVWSRAYTGSIRGRLRSLQANNKWNSAGLGGGGGGGGAGAAGMGPTVPASPARSKEPSSAALPPTSAKKVDPSASLRRADSMARKPLPFGMPSSSSQAAAPLPVHAEEGPMGGSGMDGDDSGAYTGAVHTGVVARKVAPVITAALWLDEHAGCHLATGTSDGVVRVWDGQDIAGGRWDVEAGDMEENQRSRGHAKTVGRSTGATIGAGSSRSGDPGYPPAYAQGGAAGGTWGEYVGMAQTAATGPAMISSFNAMPELRSWVYSASKPSSWMGAGAMSFAGAGGVSSMGGSDQVAGAGAGGAGLLMHWLPGYGKLVVGGGTQGYVRIWDLHTQRCAYTVPAAVGPGQAITSICGQWPGTQLLVLGTSTGAIHVVDTRLASDAASTAGAVTSALAHGGAGPSARAAVISSAAYKRSTVGLSRSAVVSVLAEHPKYVTAVAQARSGQAYSVVSASIAGDIRFWDLRQRNSVECVRKDPGITALALHDYAPLLAVGNGARQHVDIMTNTGMSLGHMAYHEGFLGQRLGPVTSLAWHPHRLLLSVGTMDSIVGLYHGSPIIEKDR